MFTSLDSFIKFDERFSILQSQSYHSVLLIARLYTSDSIKYKKEANYWLNYLAKLALSIDNDKLKSSALKQAQVLRCAYLIDHGERL